MMKLYSIIVFLLFANYLHVNAENKTSEEVDIIVANYMSQGLYASASNVLVDYAIQCNNKGDAETALKYQQKNANLVNFYPEYMAEHGLSIEGFYSNWLAIMSLQMKLNKYDDAIRTYLQLEEGLAKYIPDQLPFYFDTIDEAFCWCNESSIKDSVNCFQRTLDIIKQMPVSENNVKRYVKFCRNYYFNRFLVSHSGNIQIKDKSDEIIDFFNKNRKYIEDLDICNNEKVQFFNEFADELYGFASIFSAQQKDYVKAINFYNYEIEVLKPWVKLERGILQKIAACNAGIANAYSLLGDKVKSKEYCDLAFSSLFYHKEDYEYCDILNSLAIGYFNIHDMETASKLKFTEIETRKHLGYEPSFVDVAMYMMYKQGSPKEVIAAQSLVNENTPKTDFGIYGYYLQLAKAYCNINRENVTYKDSIQLYLEKSKNEIITHEDSLKKIGLNKVAWSNLYSGYALFYSVIGNQQLSYLYSKKSLEEIIDKRFQNYYEVALKATLLKDSLGVEEFLPKYYYGMEKEVCDMIPMLGSTESNTYLMNGYSDLYLIPGWTCYNPYNETARKIGYNALLLQKGLILRYNSFHSNTITDMNIQSQIAMVNSIRDSIFQMTDGPERSLAIKQYEQEERRLAKKIADKDLTIHWNDVQKSLNDDEACIEFARFQKFKYSWDEERQPKWHYAAYVLTSQVEVPVFVDLFDEEEFSNLYIYQPKSFDSENSSSFYDILWNKLRPYIENKKIVYFSPTGILQLTNIEMLMNNSGQIALEQFNLKRVSSTRILLQRFVEKDNENKMLVFGGIDYEKNTSILGELNDRGNWAYLKSTQDEAIYIKKMYPTAQIYTDTKASESNFKNISTKGFNVLHFASHGYYITPQKREEIPYYYNSEYTKNMQDELFYSGLIMSGGQKNWTEQTFSPEKNDGILTSYEISKLDLSNYKLVVLSACESGLGDNLYDGIYGLQRAFKKAGVKTLMMSLWKIDDKATCDYMSKFYEFLSTGMDKNNAYRKSVIYMRQKYIDPYYWASFIMLD